jgi:thioredoxin 1
MNPALDKSQNEHALTVIGQSRDSEVPAAGWPFLPGLRAVWCGQRGMISALIHELTAENFGSVTAAGLDLQNGPETVAQLGNASIPTLLLFRCGQLFNRVAGSRQGKRRLTSWTRN